MNQRQAVVPFSRGPELTLIESAGATLMYLPPYSPGLNPIEMLFAQLKAYLRKTKARTIETLWCAIGDFIKTVTPQQCANYIAHDGYASM
jgi:transposase